MYSTSAELKEVEIDFAAIEARVIAYMQAAQPLTGKLPTDDCECDDHDDKIVRFWIGRRYFDDCNLGNSMRDVLRGALNMNNLEANRATTERGCWVTCRESQFARFLIERNERGLPNLFQELRVAYHVETKRPEIDVTNRG